MAASPGRPTATGSRPSCRRAARRARSIRRARASSPSPTAARAKGCASASTAAASSSSCPLGELDAPAPPPALGGDDRDRRGLCGGGHLLRRALVLPAGRHGAVRGALAAAAAGDGAHRLRPLRLRRAPDRRGDRGGAARRRGGRGRAGGGVHRRAGVRGRARRASLAGGAGGGPSPARMRPLPSPEALDAALQRANDDYAAHRRGAQLAPPEVVLLPPGAFAAWMRAQGKLGGQHKVPRVIADPERFAAAEPRCGALAGVRRRRPRLSLTAARRRSPGRAPRRC